MKSFPAKQAVAAILTTLALGFGAHRFLQPSSTTPTGLAGGSAGELAAAASAEAQNESAPALPLRSWKLGDSFVYEFDTTRGMTMTQNGQADQPLSYHVVGKMSLTVIGKEANEVHLRADVRPVRVDVSPKTDKNAKALVSGTFYASVLSNGEIKEFFFPREIPAEARILLKGFVNSLQMVASPKPANTWRVMEADVSGEYRAAYHAVNDKTIEKSKTEYVRTRGPAGFLPLQKGTQYVVKSKATFGIDASGWPKALTEDESLEVSAQGVRVVGTNKTTANLVGIEAHPEWIGAFPAKLESDEASEAAAMALAKQQADVNMVGGRSFATIMGELNAKESSARSQAQARMAALFRVNPNEAKNAVDEVLHGQGDTNSKKRLIGALGSAGTPEAQHELARLLGTEEAGDNRINAAIAMSLTKHPTEETADALQKAATSGEKRVGSTAILASGNVIRSMNADKIGDTADALQMLINGLANASTDHEKQVYLEALGNSGDARALDVIMPYLSHTTVALRATATGTLKFMMGPIPDKLLIAAMSDSEFSVRRAAVQTIPFRPIADMLQDIDTLLRNEPEQSIRIEILKGLNMKLVEESSAIDLIEWAMENDLDAAVRSYAKQIFEHTKLDT